jgi:3-oxoacyl-[acyl-carrier protein] reductase
LAANGAHVLAGSRATTTEFSSRLDSLASTYEVPVSHLPLDVTDPESIKQALSSIRRNDRPLWGLVNNAGVTNNALLQMSDLATAHDLFETNFFGLLSLMQGCVRLMARQRTGSIVNVASTAAIDGNPGKSVYGASKAAVITLTKSSARELGPLGIRVNAVAPGVTETDMLSSMSEEVVAEAEMSTDMGRRGQPHEIAEAICFLLSPLSSYVSGQVLRVDGGMRP